MSTRENENMPTQAADPDAVEHYLRDHPEFFVTREELLAELSLPHACGSAVSLIERQVDLLREQNRRYRAQLHELLKIAHNNDKLIGHLQHLTLSLMDSSGLEEILTLLQASLKQDFHADAATMRLFSEAGEAMPTHLELDFMDVGFIAQDDLMESLKKTLSNSKPLCGRLKEEQLGYLFGDDSGRIASAALIPLVTAPPFAGHARRLGMLAIGSYKAERFNPELGTTYLSYLGRLISRKLARHLTP